ncbi:hypothetical protein FOL47_007935 [Perkinsus chesapeaki]|uniref:Amino acid transporter transmembrane domain-containing protein n=1 Tax=Perkinsus chesapeaki TaxID=330153 RepID=A0A7J6MUN3_PERCH|nr:hypothetical protein FOL47_007935 [Perkinsus chesapeaki]
MPVVEASDTIDSIKSGVTPSHGQSNMSAVANIALTGIGVGMLSLPRAIAQAGYAFGFILMVFSAVVGILYTQLLRACMKPETRSYEDIGMDVFGRWGLFAVTFGVNGALIGTCCLLMLLLGQNSYKLYPAIPQPYWILIWTCILLPLSWLPNMKHIGYISGTVGVSSVICLLLVLIYAGFARALNPEIHDDISHDPYPVTAIGLGMSFASMTLAFAVTCASTTVLHDMKYPQARRRVVYWGLCIIAIVYFLVSLSGYIGWGNSLLKFQNIIDAVTGSGSGHDVVSYISICLAIYRLQRIRLPGGLLWALVWCCIPLLSETSTVHSLGNGLTKTQVSFRFVADCVSLEHPERDLFQIPGTSWGTASIGQYKDTVDIYCEADLNLQASAYRNVDPFLSYCLCSLIQLNKCGELHHSTYLPKDHKKFCSRECRDEINALVLCRERRFKARSKQGAHLLNTLGKLMVEEYTSLCRPACFPGNALVEISRGQGRLPLR